MTKKQPIHLKAKKPWPTKEAMIQVYKQHLWGGIETDFYSGVGSHQPEIVVPYIESVTLFLNSFREPLSVCDLGCGDFNIGKQLILHTKNYIGVDIVPDLIERNKAMFQEPTVTFQCLDIAKHDLPLADCAILRQVLQHLSNAEIHQIVERLKQYQFVILTEHLPEGDFEPNIDIISGQGIRLKKQSGINLLGPPFYLKTKQETPLCAISLGPNKGRIVTTLFQLF